MALVNIGLIGVSVKRLRQLGVVGEINDQPFDVEGRIVERPELRALVLRVLASTVASAGALATGRSLGRRGGQAQASSTPFVACFAAALVAGDHSAARD